MHRYANPAQFLRLARPLTPALFWAGLVLVFGACLWGLIMTPTERLMGDTVKIMFVHVPAAWLGMAASFGRNFGAGDRYAGRSICGAVPDHRFDLGPSDMGHLVGLGWTADIDAGAVLPLSRLYRAGSRVE
jgi:hypothetical protein